MVTSNGQTGMLQFLARKLLPLAAGIALLIAILAPATYWILAHHNLQHMVTLYAEDLAGQLRQMAQESPSLWKYQTYKFIMLTEGFHPTIEVSGFRVLDERGQPIAGHDYHQNGWGKPGTSLSFPEELKCTLGTAPILFNDRWVGTVEVLADDAPTVRTTTLFFGLASLVGMALALLVYRFPLRVAGKMEEKIEVLIANVRRSEEDVRRLNDELEMKVKEKTRQLLEAQEDLVRKGKLAILGQLSGSVGHELRNPLGVMSNAVYLLEMVHADGDETTKEYLGIIKKEIDNSLRIITDLLDFARTKPPQTVSVSVRQLLEESLGKCVISEQVRLQTDLPDDLPLLKVDPLQMTQVFQNLIINAVQAMSNGGSLYLSAGRVQAAFENAPGVVRDYVAIAFADTGEGVAPENMVKLFQPLFTTKAKGIGLGLVVCRNLIEANGGKIQVTSRPGEGTIFTVMLPIREENCD